MTPAGARLSFGPEIEALLESCGNLRAERWQRGRLRSVANRVSGDATEVRILDVPPVCVQRGESALTLRGIAERVGSGGVAVTRVSHRRADAPGVQSVERPSTEGVLRLGWPRGPGPPSEDFRIIIDFPIVKVHLNCLSFVSPTHFPAVRHFRFLSCKYNGQKHFRQAISVGNSPTIV